MFLCKYKNKSKHNFSKSSTKIFSMDGVRFTKSTFAPLGTKIILCHPFILIQIQTIISARIVNKYYSMTTFFQKIIENPLKILYKHFVSLFLKHNVQGGQGG